MKYDVTDTAQKDSSDQNNSHHNVVYLPFFAKAHDTFSKIGVTGCVVEIGFHVMQLGSKNETHSVLNFSSKNKRYTTKNKWMPSLRNCF